MTFAVMVIKYKDLRMESNKQMTYEEAKKIIDPKTTTEAYVECYMSSGAIMSAEIWKARVDEACEIAAEALEKQMPKKPINEEHYYMCPCCRGDLGVSDDDIFIYELPMPKYCGNCGHALDWSEVVK